MERGGVGRRMEKFGIRCGEGQERWLNGHENEWKSATDRDEEVWGGGASPGQDRDVG